MAKIPIRIFLNRTISSLSSIEKKNIYSTDIKLRIERRRGGIIIILIAFILFFSLFFRKTFPPIQPTKDEEEKLTKW